LIREKIDDQPKGSKEGKERHTASSLDPMTSAAAWNADNVLPEDGALIALSEWKKDQLS